jgi:hypothetical protein
VERAEPVGALVNGNGTGRGIERQIGVSGVVIADINDI